MQPNSCHGLHAPLLGGPGGHSHGQSHGPRDGPERGHSHGHGHGDGHRPRQRRALLVCLALTAAMLVVEVLGGIWTGSLMLLSDAVHMLSHALAAR